MATRALRRKWFEAKERLHAAEVPVSNRSYAIDLQNINKMQK